ncbi:MULTISPECIES: TQO small subunit DoxD [Myroides]|uniref:DoxX family membrane protein n=1 Tax=Myroides albus TaxID=2562892 RepID=A0A6I3LSA2_9FLAO|nr:MULTISPECIES: TQO small subunit DoxD [Myroides]MTG98982.1 DoxX family membrane protein [Myroides albus]MVX35784.1 DoxX family membrane protein [Myroides sp. LoEW2-1]UVD78266.1 DoxX family membrane protein [Myroides albus]
MQTFNKQSFTTAGFFTLAIRLVVGWTYFSAFWRRLILENKLIETEAGYIGVKFNHFLPNAIGIKPIIEYLVTHPDLLWWAMVIFTIVEAIVGLFIMLGLFTRLMSIGVVSLAMGILLGSGWIGTTCLDEWQIGVLGVATGFILFLTGGGYGSLDYYFEKKGLSFTNKKWFGFLGSGVLPIKNLKPIVFVGSFAILLLTLYTNQVFHGGVFGTLHNKSVKPKIELNQVNWVDNSLKFEVYRVEGADVYGSFLIGVQLETKSGRVIQHWDGKALSQVSEDSIDNAYVAQVKAGKHSMVIPLGAKAILNFQTENSRPSEDVVLRLIDISGIEWTAEVK